MAGNIVKIQIKADADTRAIETVKAQLASLRNKTVKVNVDIDRDKLRALDNLGDRRRSLSLDLDIDEDAFRELGGRRATIEVDADTAAAEGSIDNAARDRRSTITVSTNRREIDRLSDSVSSATRSVTNLGDSFSSSAAGGSRFFNRVSRLGPVLVALAPAVATLASGAIGAGVYGVAAALGAVTGVAGGLGAAVTLGIAAIPIAAAAASQEVRDSFSYMGKDVVSTMKEIAVPVQKPLQDLATATGAAFHQIRPNLEEITRGTAGLVNTLSGAMPAIAGKFGPALQQAFQAGIPHVENLIRAMPRLTESVGNFFGSLGSPEVVEGAKRIFEQTIPNMIEGAGNGIEKLAGGFNAVMGFLDSGRMDGFGEGISKFMNNLSNTDWSGVTNAIAGAANAFGSFVGGINTENLAADIEGLASFAADLTGVAAKVEAAYAALNKAMSGGSEGDKGGPSNPVELGGAIYDKIAAAAKALAGNPVKLPLEPEIAGEVQLPPGTTAELPMRPVVEGSLDPIAGQIARNGGPLEVPITPKVEGDPIAGQITRNGGIPVVVKPELQGDLPSLPPAPLPVNPEVNGAVPPLPPMEQPITPGPVPEIPPPPPVPVDVQVANGELGVVPPPPVPITFNVTQPTLELVPPPPVPITFNVAMPTINIPVPPPVPVTVNVPPVDIAVPQGLTTTVTVTSNAAAVAGQISALSGMSTSSSHTITTNAAAAAAEISSLNGRNTSSTHTVNITHTGSLPSGVPLPR